MNQTSWPKYLGSFFLYQDSIDCATIIPSGQKLSPEIRQPEFDFSISKNGNITAQVNLQKLVTPLLTSEDEYFADINHFYSEIWNFLYQFIQLDVSIEEFNGIRYKLLFKVYLKKDILEINLEDDVKLKKGDFNEDYKKQYYQKEVIKYARESFLILADILELQKPVEAFFKSETSFLEKIIYQKYRSKPWHFRLSLLKNIIIPELKIEDEYEGYYKQNQRSKVTKANLEKISAALVSESTHSQAVQSVVESVLEENKSKRYNEVDCIFQMKTELFKYQKQGIQWMLYREGCINEEQLGVPQSKNLHKMWSQFKLPNGDFLYFNEFSGEMSEEMIEFKDIKGGIVGDQMGLGKSIQAIGLILKAKELECKEVEEFIEPEMKKKIKPNFKRGQTLLIVPLSVIGHWQQEFKLHTKSDSLKYYEYYSQQSRQQQRLDLSIYDVVITTYGVLSRDYQNNSYLFKYEWKRVILDEAHIIKGKGTLCAKAAYNLKTERRWCLTGTPLQNQLDDLFSLFHFLQIDTFSDYYWFNNYINKRQQDKEFDTKQVFTLLHRILDPIFLRRTKESTYTDGQLIISLPKKYLEIVKVKFTKEEENIYRMVYLRTKKELKNIISNKVLKQRFFHIFSIISFLRQLCDSPFLFIQKILLEVNESKIKAKIQNEQQLSRAIDGFFKRSAREKDQSNFEDSDELEDRIENSQENEEIKEESSKSSGNINYQNDIKSKLLSNQIKNEICSFCQHNMLKNVSLLPCGHCYDQECFQEFINQKKKNQEPYQCPICRLQISSLYEENKQHKQLLEIQDPNEISSKFRAVIQALDQIQIGEKVVIYSQWIKVIDFLQAHLIINKISFVRLDGSMSKQQRINNIEHFNKNCKVIIISLKAGAYGINLSAANNVFIIDPWWNPAVEDQAIERVHRYGQNREVKIKMFIVENSIEERVLELHKIKQKLINDTLHLRQSEDQFDYLQQISFILNEQSMINKIQ